MLTTKEINSLIVTAKIARDKAFSFKSGHSFGAAVLTSDNEIYGGCNSEGVISSLGVCAEMSAIDHAVVHGNYDFKAICVVDDNITYPCGACLQYLTQFSQVNDCDFEIIASDMNSNFEIKKLSELLPKQFKSKSFDTKIKLFHKKDATKNK
ncbi:MAG: cytidine deaminase [Microgenomates group bacterium]